MMAISTGFLVEAMVAVLLVVTIGYCILLNRKLNRLHADRSELAKLVADLMTATSLANDALRELRAVAGETDGKLTAHIARAESLNADFEAHIDAGRSVMDKIAKITSAAKREQAFEESASEPRKLQSALQALAMRPRIRGDAA